jgi:hypothetical protein
MPANPLVPPEPAVPADPVVPAEPAVSADPVVPAEPADPVWCPPAVPVLSPPPLEHPRATAREMINPRTFRPHRPEGCCTQQRGNEASLEAPLIDMKALSVGLLFPTQAVGVDHPTKPEGFFSRMIADDSRLA